MKLFDWHCDTLTTCQEQGKPLLKNDLHIDIRRGGTLFEQWIQVMAVYVSDSLDENDAPSYVQRSVEYFKNNSRPLSNTSFLLALENGKGIGSNIRNIELLAQQGFIYITLTWNGSNRLGHGCLSKAPDGLTPFGKEVVNTMYPYGILPDISHLNEAGSWDVLRLANGRPVLASHSLSASIHPHPRNISDSLFKQIRDSHGIVGLHLCGSHLGEQSFERFERHVSHFLSLDGERTVAIGLDLDGTDLPNEWDGIAVAPKLYQFLRAKDYSVTLLNRLFFENSYNFFRENFDISAIMR